MRRRDLLRRVNRAANGAGLDNGLLREGGNHSKYRCCETTYIVPRHNEINEMTAHGILKTLDAEFGKDWWR